MLTHTNPVNMRPLTAFVCGVVKKVDTRMSVVTRKPSLSLWLERPTLDQVWMAR